MLSGYETQFLVPCMCLCSTRVVTLGLCWLFVARLEWCSAWCPAMWCGSAFGLVLILRRWLNEESSLPSRHGLRPLPLFPRGGLPFFGGTEPHLGVWHRFSTVVGLVLILRSRLNEESSLPYRRWLHSMLLLPMWGSSFPPAQQVASQRGSSAISLCGLAHALCSWQRIGTGPSACA